MNFLQLIPKLRESNVEFVVIGGVAAIFHGVERVTMDLDLAAPMDLDNLRLLIGALADVRPKFRMRSDLPIITPDNHNLKSIKNLYLITDIGQLDVLGFVEGVGDFEAVAKRAIRADLGQGIGPCRILDMDGLIASKRTAGRPKDMPVVFALEELRKRRPPHHN